MTLREFLELPYTEDGKTCSAREHICHWVNSHVRAGWHEGGEKGRVGTFEPRALSGNLDRPDSL